MVGAIALSLHAPRSTADTTTYTTSLQSGNMCTGCGPFGTVSVSTVSGNADQLFVSLTLTSGEVFANTGAGAALLFDIQTNPTLSVSGLTSGFGFVQATTHADGSGTWNTYIACDVCGSGTSPPQDSGPVTFYLTSSGPLSISSFMKNGPGGTSGYLFASDLGIPNGSGGYTTGDVVTTGPLQAVPLPVGAWLLISGLGGFGAVVGRRRRAQPAN